ncbi:emerin (Emery-Dreifuss muscular dystrophy) isoform 1-T1 [Odontesthes bonariensis]|uniref:emerin (Emery-Dreifuss muscular dystrophy) isoform X1 n=1 Tax=Odontesthes bonariensis TaxID=219752 RepID=UPI003F582119
MMSLSEKSEAEIQSLLTEFGIKHGPIVDSTRKLYEKKLEQAMAKVTVKQSSDKTFYREEEEEITYVTYHSPRHEVHANTLKQRGNADRDERLDQSTEPPVRISYTETNHRAVRFRQLSRGRYGGNKWKGILALLLLAALAAVFYLMYHYMG